MGSLFRFLHAFFRWLRYKMGMEKPLMPIEKCTVHNFYIFMLCVCSEWTMPQNTSEWREMCAHSLCSRFFFLSLITTVSVQFLLLLLTTDMQRTFIVLHPLFVQLPILNGQATVQPIVSIVFLKYLVHEVSSFQRTNCKKMLQWKTWIFTSVFFFYIYRSLSVSVLHYGNWHWPCYCSGIVLASCMKTAMFESM